MSRPKRPGWKSVNWTLSQQVRDYVKRTAASLGIEPGTLLDRITRAHIGLTALGNLEQSPNGVRRVSKLREDYAACAGQPKRIAGFLHGYALLSPGDTIFSPAAALEVTTPRTRTSISGAMFRSMIEAVISSSGFIPGTDLDEETVRRLDVVLQSTDQLFERFKSKKEYRLDADRRAIWTSAAAKAFGLLLGENLKPFFQKDDLDGAAAAASDSVFTMVQRYFAAVRKIGFQGSGDPPSVLASRITIEGAPDRRSDDDGDSGELEPGIIG